jgi:UDP-N-acetylglucosamine 2-epimerase (non-hydrolysing)
LYKRIDGNKKVLLTEPMGYFAFQKLISECNYILTDSGGIQEESTYQRVPCLTLRPNTERPSTMETGSNTLVPFDLDEITRLINLIKEDKYKKGRIPSLWDGNATYRILEALQEELYDGFSHPVITSKTKQLAK